MKIHLLWAVMIAIVAGAGGGMVGFQFAANNEESPEPVKVAEVKPPVKKKAAQVAKAATLSDEDIENLIAEVEDDPKPKFDTEKLAEMEARRKRWENMSIDQRRMFRKALFSALAEVDGLEEVEDAVKSGKLDPKVFKFDPEGIADRMEYFADTMDQQSMKTEVTKTLQSIVDQANTSLGK
ncbi:MAG: hypothetical protein ACKVJU_21485 [Verrucomicrobiales bacterium]